jgi:hypothetical protein
MMNAATAAEAFTYITKLQLSQRFDFTLLLTKDPDPHRGQ